MGSDARPLVSGRGMEAAEAKLLVTEEGGAVLLDAWAEDVELLRVAARWPSAPYSNSPCREPERSLPALRPPPPSTSFSS